MVGIQSNKTIVNLHITLSKMTKQENVHIPDLTYGNSSTGTQFPRCRGLECSIWLWHFLVKLTYSVVGWYVVGDCDISWSFSLKVPWVGMVCECDISWSNSLKVPCVRMWYVIMTFSGHTH